MRTEIEDLLAYRQSSEHIVRLLASGATEQAEFILGSYEVAGRSNLYQEA
jgi:hypothetical protein